MTSIGVLAFILLSLSCMGQDSTTKDIAKADEKLIDLMFFGLDHGVESIEASGVGPLVPFTVTETSGERKLSRFLTERLEDGLEEGVNYLVSDVTSEFAIIVYDGYLTVEGQKFDAVLVKGFDRKDKVGYLIGQRYQLKKLVSPFRIIGNPAFLGNEKQLLK